MIEICIKVVEYANYHIAPAVWFVLNRMRLTHSLTHSRQGHYVYRDVWTDRDTRFSNCQSTNILVRVSRSRMAQRVRWAYAAQCNETSVDIMCIEMTLNVYYSPA